MRFLIGATFLLVAILAFLGMILVSVGTLYVALTDSGFDHYARQIALIVVFAISWVIFGIAGTYLRATSR